MAKKRTRVEELEIKVRWRDRRIARLERRNSQLEEQSTVDELTGALNRRGFMPQLQNRLSDMVQLEEDKRRGELEPVSAVLYIDLDGFKTVNDQAGHDVGDQILSNVARSLDSALRHRDVLARFGGDEFVALVQVGNDTALRYVVNRLRQAVERVAVTAKGQQWRVGASIGVSILMPGDSPERVIERADQLMYQDKACRKQARA